MSQQNNTRGKYKKFALFGATEQEQKVSRETLRRWKGKKISASSPYNSPLKSSRINEAELPPNQSEPLSFFNQASPPRNAQTPQDEEEGIFFQSGLESDMSGEESPRLFSGSKISEKESCLMLFAFCMRYKLSDSALGDLLNLINFHLPEGASVPPSVYLLQKFLGTDQTSARRHWYCKTCSVLLDEEQIKENMCKTCNQTPPFGTENYFVTFDIRNLLESLLKRTDIKEAVSIVLSQRKNREVGVWEDIWDGDAYKALQLGDTDLTCCLNTDGISPFKKASYQIWPILLSLNELPFKLRRKNTILVGLWFGKCKPIFKLFLKPFIGHAVNLAHLPLRWQNGHCEVESKVYFPMCAADSPARCKAQCVNQHNGAHSCNWCEVKGGLHVLLNEEWTQFDDLEPGQVKQKTKKKRVFDPQETAPERDQKRHISQAAELGRKVKVYPKLKHVVGVRGASQLLLLPKFNIVEGFVFDYMHTVLLGTLSAITTMLIESSNHNEPFYIGRSKEVISARIRQYKSPSECSRHLRDLNDIAYWKANEWKQWFLICVSVLNGILPEKYLRHLTKFIHAFTLLLQNRIYEDDIVVAEALIQQFSQSVPELYGIQNCTFNLHILNHAAKCVRNWGPLWCYSLFQFESFNGLLTNCFHGTAKIGAQISRKYMRAQQVYALGDVGISNPFASSFCSSLLSGKHYYKESLKCGECTYLGPNKPYIFSKAEIQRLLPLGFHVSEAQSYNRCVIRGKLYTATNTKFRCNNIVRVGERFYFVKALLGNKDLETGILLCRYIHVQKDKLMKNWKVISISAITRFVRADEIDCCKFITQFQGNKLVFITPLICADENE